MGACSTSYSDPDPPGSSRERFPVVVVATLTGLGYYLGAYLGVNFTLMPEGIAIVWPPNGVLLAALLMRPQREWPWYLAAIVPAELAADYPTFTVPQALAFAAVNIGEVLLAAWLLRGRRGPAITLARLREAMCFGLYAVLIASMSAAVLGAWVYQLIKTGDTGYWTFWRIWWFGDALGLLLITPLIIGWTAHITVVMQPLNWQRILEASALAGTTLLLGFIVFGGVIAQHYIPISAIFTLPLPLWAAVRFSLRGAASITLLLTVFAVAEATSDDSIFKLPDEATTVILLQEFIAILAFSSLALAALMRELRETSASLERRVAERTRELRETNARLETLATIDALTGLYNRRYFLERAGKAFAQAGRYHRPLSVVMLDVDHFKQLNDSCGHDFGDIVLRRIADTCQQELRQGDIAARYGGEEFVLMLPETAVSGAETIAERIRRAVVDLPLECGGREVPVSASFGVAGRTEQDQDISTLLKHADTALYGAKEAGRNRVAIAVGSR
jgi:diguanylate cyclase (GGDEF)-like protein